MRTTPIEDAEIKSRVELEMRWAPNLDTTHIGLAVTDGSVTLSGEVTDYSQIAIAEGAAWQVGGVIAVALGIDVRRREGPINDTDIARSVARAINSTSDVQGIHGVVQIKNEIEVSHSDAAHLVSDAVVAALKHRADRIGRALTITARGDGGVLIEGTAHSAAERDEIGAAAERAHGVTTVDNRLHIVE